LSEFLLIRGADQSIQPAVVDVGDDPDVVDTVDSVDVVDPDVVVDADVEETVVALQAEDLMSFH
jgi:hypothetical protein